MIVATEKDKEKLIAIVTDWKLAKPMWVWSTSEQPKRSTAQNSILYKWYEERSKHTENGALYERCSCKLSYGVPILLASDRKACVSFQDCWSEIYSRLSYELQFKAMEFVEVSSIMSVKEMINYLNMIDTESGIQGIRLTKPDEYGIAIGEKV